MTKNSGGLKFFPLLVGHYFDILTLNKESDLLKKMNKKVGITKNKDLSITINDDKSYVKHYINSPINFMTIYFFTILY